MNSKRTKLSQEIVQLVKIMPSEAGVISLNHPPPLMRTCKKKKKDGVFLQTMLEELPSTSL
jgi:hypothetical protein